MQEPSGALRPAKAGALDAKRVTATAGATNLIFQSPTVGPLGLFKPSDGDHFKAQIHRFNEAGNWFPAWPLKYQPTFSSTCFLRPSDSFTMSWTRSPRRIAAFSSAT